MTPANGKNVTNMTRKFKITDFLWVSDFVPGDFFVGIVMLHECTDFSYMYVKT